ncbi:serine hydrolase domain-containing protein [Kutzneria chonburiensis]|uniref:Serine hydrolase domain-containing protein n=1 Tax=Kutzneria chonburiensis TaxID=1483604 RepID=A0ABV6MVE9_9PSEU|nr:serine hydrolase domain-containing protein [Kutzneria chonburiensis]
MRWLHLVTAAAVTAGTVLCPPAESDLQRLTRDLLTAGAPGVIVRVDDGHGRPVEIAQQADWTKRDHRLDPDDEYRVGSNTKTMMATLVLQLVAADKLALTDPVEKWLPGQVPNGNAITLKMLLQHTSGLFDYTNDDRLLPSVLGKDPHPWTSQELLAIGVSNPPKFPPGTKWEYSNTNYVAIGAVLEHVTGHTIADLVRDRIARPLGLRHTYFATDGTWFGPHVRGYEPDAAHMPAEVPAEVRDLAGPQHDGHVDVSNNSPRWGGAAGAVVSNAEDWSRFYEALMGGKLLPAAQLAQLRDTVPVAGHGNGAGYGLGIDTVQLQCGTVWGHDGGIPGYLSEHFTDGTGRRTGSVLISTEFFSEFGAEPKLGAAFNTLVNAAVCAMFDKPVSADPS